MAAGAPELKSVEKLPAWARDNAPNMKAVTKNAGLWWEFFIRQLLRVR